MPALFGGPPPDPDAPRAVVAVQRGDRRRVVGEVVLGEEVHEQRAAHRGIEVDLAGVPRFAGDEVAAPAPRHELVREPFLGPGEVALERLFDGRLELGDEGGVVHAGQSTY